MAWKLEIIFMKFNENFIKIDTEDFIDILN